MEIDAVTFVVIDVETTGLDPAQGDRVCEVGAIKIQAGRELGRFESLVNPERDIPEPARAKNRITDEMVREAPTFAAIAPKLRPFLAGTVFVAQNAEFDLGFVNAEFVRAGMGKLTIPAADTIPLARRVRPGLPRYNLDTLAHHFGLKFNSRHRSIGDCEVTVRVFLECLKALRQRGEVRSLEDLVRKGGVR
ncbi:MAG: 3'-5' exonuclease [Planctomycetes bacterium]|nr:3'-5' exonuclease [Planctomycetota bacterium]